MLTIGPTLAEFGRLFVRAVGVDMASSMSWELPTTPLLAPSDMGPAAEQPTPYTIRVRYHWHTVQSPALQMQA